MCTFDDFAAQFFSSSKSTKGIKPVSIQRPNKVDERTAFDERDVDQLRLSSMKAINLP